MFDNVFYKLFKMNNTCIIKKYILYVPINNVTKTKN